MTFLPIVARELRVAARRKSTFYIRWVTALIGVILGGMGLAMAALNNLAGRSSGVSMGMNLFYLLAWYLFAICLLAGVFLAADCLSEERREGTLGFLFLTDLTGYDVVLGKLMGVSLNAFYGLLSVFPVLGISLVLGGITGAEFGRVCLALINALWFSITVALWVSSRCESSFRAMAQTLAWLVFFAVVLPVIVAALPASAWAMTLGSISPFEPFQFAQAAYFLHGEKDFWVSLAVSHLAGWLFLGWASWRLPRLLESRPAGEEVSWWRKLLAGDFLFGKKRRLPELLEINPVLWLVDDASGLRWMNWVLSIVGGVLMAAVGTMGKDAIMFLPYVARPFFFLFKFLFALQVCRFFSEARRNGSLELLATTPLALTTMIEGQWRALRRLFLRPVVVFMAAEILAVTICACWFGLKGGNAGALALTLFFSVPWQLGTAVTDFLALGWLGMWLALMAKKPQSAAGLTVLFVLVLPSIAFCVPSLIVDVVIIIVYMSKLGRDFRVLLAEAEGKRTAVGHR